MSNEQSRARARGKDNERSLAEDIRARGYATAKRVPLSGALHEMPGDVSVTELNLLIEAKVYETIEISGAHMFRLNLDWLWKIIDESRRIGLRNACVVIRGKKLRKRAVLSDYDDYFALVRDAEAWRAQIRG